MAGPAQADFKYWDVTDTSKTPRSLSATGLYVDISAPKKVVSPNVYRFEVNSPLWSDGAHATRWVVARPGKPIVWDTTDYWTYSDSAVFVKELDIDTIAGDTTSRVKWETQILINRKELGDSNVVTGKKTYRDHWYGFSFKWNTAQNNAVLVTQRYGANDSLVVWPAGKVGASRKKKWHFSSQDECSKCHRSNMPDTNIHERSVLGFFTAQLNRQASDTSVTLNQLDYFFAHNVLDGNKPANWSGAPKWADLGDTASSIDLRARSYIGSNCSGCHGRRGMIGGAFAGIVNYDYYNMKVVSELRHLPVNWDFYLNDSLPIYYPKLDGNNPARLDSLRINIAEVIPGYPSKSLLLHRVKSRRTEPGNYDPILAQMPPLGAYEVDDSAVTLLQKWITDMPKTPQDGGATTKLTPSPRSLAEHPFFIGRTLRIPEQDLGMAVSLTGISGQALALTPMNGSTYALPASMPRGLYVIRIGQRAFLRYWFY